MPVDVLTAVFFDISGNPLLHAGDATVASGSVFETSWTGHGPHSVTTLAGITDVSSEWAFRQGQASGFGRYGIGSAGLGVFGPGDRFDTTGNLQGPVGVGGLQYGVASLSDDRSTGNGDFNGTQLIQGQVVFTLSVPDGFSLSQISHVNYVFGTTLGNPPPSTPDAGSTLALLGLALTGTGWLRRRICRE